MTFEEIYNAIECSSSMQEAASKLNLSRYKFNKLAKEYGVWTPNQGGKGVSKNRKDGNGKIPLSEILEGKHPYYKTTHLKDRLFKEGFKKNECEICGISEWNGKSIKCQLDHINGNAYDHTLMNIRILCPNCHSQTDTFCGKNK